MLVQFSIENYRSFRDRATLSMVAGDTDEQLPDNTFAGETRSEIELLRSAALYGANASGKSNIIRALQFMARFVERSAVKTASHTERIDVAPYLLDERTAEGPCEFEVVVIAGKTRYLYGFRVDAQQVHEEWLYSYPHGRARKLFARTAKGKRSSFSFGDYWRGERQVLADRTRPNALFLSVAQQFNNPTVRPVFEWFAEMLHVAKWLSFDGTALLMTSALAREDDAFRTRVSEMLRAADTGVEGIRIEELSLRSARIWGQMPASVREQIQQEHSDPRTLEVSTKHLKRLKDGSRSAIEFDLSDESDGTQKFYALAGPFLRALEHGHILVIDELDARLHPLLTRWIVRKFHDPKLNHGGSQLIFTTHDDNLLDLELMRRDQIWMIDKPEGSASELYSLHEFKQRPRTRDNIRRGYLAGRYRGIPILED